MRCAPLLGPDTILAGGDISVDGAPATPYSMDRPFVFHVFTEEITVERIWELAAGGGALMPAEDREKRSKVFGRDMAAGDGQYVFLSPFSPIETEWSRNQPALAFDMLSIADALAFRLHDLEHAYAHVQREVGEVHVEPDFGEEDGEEWDAEYAEADVLRDDLTLVAEIGTITKPEHASYIVGLVNALLGGMPYSAGDRAMVESMLPPALNADLSDAIDFLAAHEFLPSFQSSMREMWGAFVADPTHEFYARPAPRLWTNPSDHPEVLHRGPLPMCCATMFRPARSAQWHPVPPEVCMQGAALYGVR